MMPYYFVNDPPKTLRQDTHLQAANDPGLSVGDVTAIGLHLLLARFAHGELEVDVLAESDLGTQ